MKGGRRDVVMTSGNNISVVQSLRNTQIVIAIVMIVSMGCVLALFYTHAFFHTYPSSTPTTKRFFQSSLQVWIMFKVLSILFWFVNYLWFNLFMFLVCSMCHGAKMLCIRLWILLSRRSLNSKWKKIALFLAVQCEKYQLIFLKRFTMCPCC